MRLLLLLLFCPAALLSQKKVSEHCAAFRMKGDSIMRATYGDSIFKKYIVLDTESWAGNNPGELYTWNHPFPYDSVLHATLVYNFLYPGARPLRIHYVSLQALSSGEYTIRPYNPRCINVPPSTLRELTRKKLHARLSNCSVSIYQDTTVRVKNEFISLEKDHVYLRVERRRYFLRYRRTKMLLVDGCSGTPVCKKKWTIHKKKKPIR